MYQDLKTYLEKTPGAEEKIDIFNAALGRRKALYDSWTSLLQLTNPPEAVRDMLYGLVEKAFTKPHMMVDYLSKQHIATDSSVAAKRDLYDKIYDARGVPWLLQDTPWRLKNFDHRITLEKNSHIRKLAGELALLTYTPENRPFVDQAVRYIDRALSDHPDSRLFEQFAWSYVNGLFSKHGSKEVFAFGDLTGRSPHALNQKLLPIVRDVSARLLRQQGAMSGAGGSWQRRRIDTALQNLANAHQILQNKQASLVELGLVDNALSHVKDTCVVQQSNINDVKPQLDEIRHELTNLPPPASTYIQPESSYTVNRNDDEKKYGPPTAIKPRPPRPEKPKKPKPKVWSPQPEQDKKPPSLSGLDDLAPPIADRSIQVGGSPEAPEPPNNNWRHRQLQPNQEPPKMGPRGKVAGPLAILGFSYLQFKETTKDQYLTPRPDDSYFVKKLKKDLNLVLTWYSWYRCGKIGLKMFDQLLRGVTKLPFNSLMHTIFGTSLQKMENVPEILNPETVNKFLTNNVGTLSQPNQDCSPVEVCSTLARLVESGDVAIDAVANNAAVQYEYLKSPCIQRTSDTQIKDTKRLFRSLMKTLRDNFGQKVEDIRLKKIAGLLVSAPSKNCDKVRTKGFHHDYKKAIENGGYLGVEKIHEHESGAHYSKYTLIGEQKLKESTHFQPDWSLDQVVDQVFKAFSDENRRFEPVKDSPNRYKIWGKGDMANFDIEIVYNAKKKIIDSAYPAIERKHNEKI
jgi:hypothetical protein